MDNQYTNNLKKRTDMKKLLLVMMGALMGLPSFAQEVDMTSSIQNPGFDEDISFTNEGKAAKPVTEVATTSASSWQKAEDGSIYTWNVEGWNSWNGFITRIKGWEVTNTSEKPEWVYFGSLPYDLPAGVMIIGRGSGSASAPTSPAGTVEVPAKPEEINTDDNTGVLQLRAGWGNQCTYKQVVSVPCAVYRLDYWVKATGGTEAATNLSNVTCRKSVFRDSEGLSAREWTKHSIEFTPVSEFTIEFGMKAANSSSNKNPIIWIDGIKLYRIADADPSKILEGDLADLTDSLYVVQTAANVQGCSGLVDEVGDAVWAIDEVFGGSEAEMEAALKSGTATFEHVKLALAAVEGVSATVARMAAVIERTAYPGLDDFTAVYNKMKDYVANGNSEQILGAEAEATAAIRAYAFSQQASEATPADYTLLVQAPWFIKSEAEPVLDSDTYVFPNADSYVSGSGSSVNTDLISTGWVKTGKTDGGDKRLNWRQGRSCWNAWDSGFTSELGIAQQLTDLPRGYYTVSADMITQEGMRTNQHVFAESSAQRAISPSLANDSWSDDDNGTWETLTTSEKLLVTDGVLTIGAESKGSGSGAQGWFLVTNFRLNYLGEASEEDLKKAFDEKVAAADALAARMHFAADKKAFVEVIDANRSTTSYDEALVAINAAQSEAEKSEAKYEEYMEPGKTLPTVADSLARDGYEAAHDIVKYAYDYVQAWLASDEATYTKIDATVNLLKNYLNTYTPVYNEAAQLLATLTNESCKTYLTSVMNGQKEALMAQMCESAVVSQYVSDLKAARALVNKQIIVDQDGATDYTAYIQNRNAEAKDGWNVLPGKSDDGKWSSSGQWYTGETSVRYFDAYCAKDSVLNYYAEQLVSELPNGTYTLGCYVRTSGPGAFVLYKTALTDNAADSVWTEIPVQTYTYLDENTGQTVTETVSSTRGKVWEEARDLFEGGLLESDPRYELINGIYNANSGKGHGWMHMELTDIKVDNHQLLIGMSTDIERTGKQFESTWFSVGGFTLTLTAKGDNTGWEGPIASDVTDATIKGVELPDGIYTLTGVRINALQRGLNIVVRGNNVEKVLVK